MSFSPPIKNYETHLRLQKVKVTRVQGAVTAGDERSVSEADKLASSPAPTESLLVSLAVDVPMAERYCSLLSTERYGSRMNR